MPESCGGCGAHVHLLAVFPWGIGRWERVHSSRTVAAPLHALVRLREPLRVAAAAARAPHGAQRRRTGAGAQRRDGRGAIEGHRLLNHHRVRALARYPPTHLTEALAPLAQSSAPNTPVRRLRAASAAEGGGRAARALRAAGCGCAAPELHAHALRASRRPHVAVRCWCGRAHPHTYLLTSVCLEHLAGQRHDGSARGQRHDGSVQRV